MRSRRSTHMLIWHGRGVEPSQVNTLCPSAERRYGGRPLREFADREWGEFHTPKNLAMGLAGRLIPSTTKPHPRHDHHNQPVRRTGGSSSRHVVPGCLPALKGQTKPAGTLLARAELGNQIGLHIFTGGSLDK